MKISKTKHGISGAKVLCFIWYLALGAWCLMFLVLPEYALAEEFKEIKPRLQVNIPGLTFSSLLPPQEGGGFLFVPWISEYIAAIYRYIVGAASIFAAAMIMWGGMKWIFAAGDSGKIEKARGTIVNAVVGLILALGSYLLLFTINPATVGFESLRIRSIVRETLGGEEESDPIPEGVSPPGVTRPTWTHATYDCANPPDPAGMTPENETAVIPSLPGISNPSGQKIRRSALPAIEALSRAVEDKSRQDGVEYSIVISSGYRSFDRQHAIWCGGAGNCFKKYPDTGRRKSYCAVPGFSNHGLGVAVDVTLLKNGTSVIPISSTRQCDAEEEDVAALADIFYSADRNWYRYEREIWHFEYKPPVTQLRSKYRELPERC